MDLELVEVVVDAGGNAVEADDREACCALGERVMPFAPKLSFENPVAILELKD